MKKKYKRALAAALAAVMIWNTCDWHPQVLAGSSVQYIEEVKELSDEILHQEVPYGTKYKDLELPDKLKVRVLAEEAPDEEDSAEDKDGAEKIATPSELQSGDGEVETEKRSQTLSSSETDGTVRKASPSEADVIEKSEIGAANGLSKGCALFCCLLYPLLGSVSHLSQFNALIIKTNYRRGKSEPVWTLRCVAV